MFVAGIDAHATYSVICVVSNGGQLVHGPVRIKNAEADRLTELLEPFRPRPPAPLRGAQWGMRALDLGGLIRVRRHQFVWPLLPEARCGVRSG
jgi:hypothetical protein